MKLSWLEHALCLLVLISLSISPLIPQAATISDPDIRQVTIQDARTAFQNYKPLLATELLQEIRANSKETTPNRIRASIYLAKLRASIFDDFEDAGKILGQAIKLDPNNYELYLTYSQLASSTDRHDLALENARFATEHATTRQEKIVSFSSLANIVLEASLYKILNGPKVDQLAGFKLDNGQLIYVIGQLERALKEEPDRLELLKTKFALEVLAGNGKKALTAWRAYFNYSSDSNALLRATYSALSASLENWNGLKLNPGQKSSLAMALASARCFELSMVMIRTISEENIEANNRLKEIINYNTFLKSLRNSTTSFYQKTAVGKSDPKEYRNLLVTNAKALWATFSWDNEPKEFSLNNFENEIDQRFGASIRIGNANGWFSITWGHTVIEYSTDIEQHGRKAKVNFRSLDYLVSNGFIGWYFGSGDRIGGWQSDDLVFQVRTNYLKAPYNAWLDIADPAKAKAWEEKIKNGTTQDIELARNKEIVIFPGMFAQIVLRSRRELLSDLKQQGLTGDQLRMQFMSEYEKLTFENEILSHEGRHLIDSKLATENGTKFSAEELEYRAKLSEIAFAKYPFIALASIFDGGVGNTPHGKANERLAKAIYDWIGENWKQVKGVDPELPKPPQIYLLTNAQLVAIVRSLDPLVQRKD